MNPPESARSPLRNEQLLTVDTLHSFPPIADAHARVLILGSMPGVASLQAAQYYAHPHNQFWPIVGRLGGFDPQLPYPARCAAASRAGIAIWDVLQSCIRPGSLDADIDPASAVPNDIARLLQSAPAITLICFNGGTAETLFRRHLLKTSPALQAIPRMRLPSTSPAHAGMRPEAKFKAWHSALAPLLLPRP